MNKYPLVMTERAIKNAIRMYLDMAKQEKRGSKERKRCVLNALRLKSWLENGKAFYANVMGKGEQCIVGRLSRMFFNQEFTIMREVY